MHIAVFGAGSLGSLMGGLLTGPHRVTLVGKNPHMKAVAQNGLRISGQLNRKVSPATTTEWAAVDDPDVVIITVKTYDTADAAAAIAANPPPIVITLQNGLGPAEYLTERLPKSTVLVGTTTYGALLVEPGEVRCTGRGEIALGSVRGGRPPAAETMAAEFTRADIPCSLPVDMPRQRWLKLAVNAAINPVTALARVRNGAVLDEPLQSISVRIAEEVATIATSNGFELDASKTVDEMRAVASRTRENESSMARDVRLGRRTEIDAITGAILDHAAPSEAPINRIMYALLSGYEAGISRSQSIKSD